MKTDEQKKVLSKFAILYLATFIAILGCLRPAGQGLDTPARNMLLLQPHIPACLSPPLPQPFSFTAQWALAFPILCTSSSIPCLSAMKMGNGKYEQLNQWISQCSPWASSSSTWELVRDPNPWSPPQT